jgi:hypothetical protein
LLVPEELLEALPDEPQAASTAATAAAAGKASISRGRLNVSSRVSGLIIGFSLPWTAPASVPGDTGDSAV